MGDGSSRREFLLAVGAAVALAGCPSGDPDPPDRTPTDTEDQTSRPTDSTTGPSSTDTPARAATPSPEQPATPAEEAATLESEPTATPEPEPSFADITFENVVDAVDTLDVDDTGSEPIDAALDSALESGMLVEFPPGEYLIEREHDLVDLERVGIRGRGASRRDVRFVPPEGDAVRMFDCSAPGVESLFIENVSFDERSDDETQMAVLVRTTGGTTIRNVEFLGRTPDDGAGGYGYSFSLDVTRPDGVAVVDGVYAGLDEPAKEVEYPNGVGFLRGGPAHDGEVVLRDPVVHNRNSTATRYTNPSGVLTVEGGEFVNNQNANLRFGAGNHPSKVSSATGTYVEVDGSRNATDAVRVDASSDGDTGAVFRDIRVEWTKKDARGVISLPDWGGHGRAEFYDCTVHNDGDPEWAPTVAAQSVSETSDDAVIFENCTFTGSGGDFIAEGRPESVIRNSCIDMPNATVEGFDTKNVANACQPGSNVRSDITEIGRFGRRVLLSGTDSVATDSHLVGYRWTVRGNSYYGPRLTHTFEEPGTYPVSLTVEADSGATDTTRRYVTVDRLGVLEWLWD